MRIASTASILLAVIATSGVSSAADPLPSTDSDPARRQYEREFIGFHDVNADGSYFAYQGKYQRPLDTPAFFDAVDKPELAARYRRATTLRRGLVIPGSLLLMAGGATAVTGGVMWAMRASCPIAQEPGGGRCDTSPAEAATWVGIGAVAVGLVLDIAGALVPQPKIEPYEMREMADEHNQRLLRRLGLVSAIGPGGGVFGVRVSLD